MTDSQGQTFQPNGPDLDWRGWRWVTFDLADLKHAGHWGGPDDGAVRGTLLLDTLLLVASDQAVPDIVALAATVGGDGIVRVPGPPGSGAFAVATVNVGVAGTIHVSADTGPASLPVSLYVCETNPGTGACLADPAAGVVTTIGAGATPTFAVFVPATGAVPFAPAASRVFLRFAEFAPWEAPGSAPRGATSVAVCTGALCPSVGSASSKHVLYALNPKDIVTDNNIKRPAIEWTFTGAGGPWVASPLVIEDKLFAPNADGNLYIFDLADGQSQKQPVKTIALLDPNDPDDKPGRLWSTPVTDGERVYVTSLDHSVFGVDLATYAFWHEDVAGAIPGSPAIGADGMLYVGSLASKLEQFDPATGAHKSVLDAEYWIWSTPIVDGDTLDFGDLKGYFYSFNTSTGELNWSIQPDGPLTASALLQKGHILLATQSGNFYSVDKDGKILWTEPVGGKINTTPVSAGDLTLVAPLETDFYLAALDANGRQVWTFTPEK